MAGKPKDPKKAQTPAPGQYEKEKADKVMYGSQQYSFGLRPEQKIKSVAPAPNAYDPEKSDKIFETNPAYSFGLRKMGAVFNFNFVYYGSLNTTPLIPTLIKEVFDFLTYFLCKT